MSERKDFVEKRRNATIDFIRVIASILVNSIHTTTSPIPKTIARWTVPLINPNHDRLMKIIKNLLSLWVIWMIIYIPIGVQALVGLSFKKIVFKLVWSVIGYSVFYVGSWYLPAAAFGIWVVDYLNKRQ